MPRVYPPLEGRQPAVNISPSIVESIAGFTAGMVSTLVVHPFDVIKTRLQLKPTAKSAPGDTWRIMQEIGNEAIRENTTSTGIASRNKVVIQAFYRGLMPNMIGNSVSWALYFMWYGNIKDLVRTVRVKTQGEEKGRRLGSMDYFLASGLSGILTGVVTNPIWVIKTRMLSTSKSHPGAYKSIAHGTKTLWQKEGIKGFYRGLTPSLFGVSHGAVQFMAYEQLKNRWALGRKGGKEGLTNVDFLTLSAVSKMFAGSITYPYQVVRTKMQRYDVPEMRAREVVKGIWRAEGAAGFYKGLVPNLVRVVPSTMVTFVCYENMRYYIPIWWHGRDED